MKFMLNFGNRRLPSLKATQYLIFNAQYIAYLNKDRIHPTCTHLAKLHQL